MRTHLLLPALLAPALVLAGCAADEPARLGAPSPTPAPPTSAAAAPTATASSAAPQPSTAVTGTRSVAVYYLSGDPQGAPYLYREFHRRPATSGVVADAVRAMLGDAPRDGDYTSLWPKGTRLLGATIEGSTAVVDLSREAGRGGVGAVYEGNSFQQLVWTVTAAAPSVRQVRILVEGKPFGGWGHVDATRPMSRASSTEVIAPVWLAVEEGATLRRGARFGGEATVFEATVSWELRRGDAVVAKGFANAAQGAPGRGAWSDVVPAVAPGDYVLRAFESSAEDGRPLHVDDKRVRVS